MHVSELATSPNWHVCFRGLAGPTSYSQGPRTYKRGRRENHLNRMLSFSRTAYVWCLRHFIIYYSFRALKGPITHSEVEILWILKLIFNTKKKSFVRNKSWKMVADFTRRFFHNLIWNEIHLKKTTRYFWNMRSQDIFCWLLPTNRSNTIESNS